MTTTHPFDDDKLKEECGIFGVYGHADAAAHTALGLHALQHRGQEAAGIVSAEKGIFYTHKAIGHVSDHFNSVETISKLKGNDAIGHVRYSTTGGTVLRNAQPLFAEFSFGGFAIAHNGNLTNAAQLRKELIAKGCLFQSTSDTEVIIHLMAMAGEGSMLERFIAALGRIEGAWSLVALGDGVMIGARDPLGVRPLVLGELGGKPILASESCALDILGAEYLREINPGEVVVCSEKGIESLSPFPKQPHRFCVFEYIYFARPDSLVEGKNVYEARKRIGEQLAKEAPASADLVVPVPDSGVPAAIGFAAAAGIPFELGIIRNHYVGRTFIEPTDQVRHLGVKLKHNANAAMLKDKRVVLVDDSIVRGTTSRKIVEMVREAGAKEVHMRIASPPTTHSCFYGVDTPERSKLIAATHSVEEIGKLIGVDSLAFITVDGLYRAMGEPGREQAQVKFCDACFSGDYPIPLTDRAAGGESHKDLFATIEGSH